MYQDQYHNTTNETTEKVAFRNVVSSRQQNYILNIFFNQPGHGGFTSSEIFDFLLDIKWGRDFEPISKKEVARATPKLFISVRRSITNLLNSGHLIKTNKKRPGVSGTDNIVYQLSNISKHLL